MTDKEKDYLKAAVNVVAQQVTDNPLWGGVAVDPDVADWMGVHGIRRDAGRSCGRCSFERQRSGGCSL